MFITNLGSNKENILKLHSSFNNRKILNYFSKTFLIFAIILPILSGLPLFSTVSTSLDNSNNDTIQDENVDLQKNSQLTLNNDEIKTDLENKLENSNQNQAQKDYPSNPIMNKKSIGGITNQGDSGIKVNETFDLVGVNSGNTFNTFSNTNNDDFLTFNNASNYKSEFGHFNVSNIKSTIDHKIIENSVSSKNSDTTNSTYNAYAMSFTITNTINITAFQTMFAKLGSSIGEVFVVGSTTGQPNTTQYGLPIPLTGGSTSALTTLTYSTPLTLYAGDYFFVLNHTNYMDDIFWYWTLDGSTGDGGVLYHYDWAVTTWASFSGRDAYLTYEYTLVNPSNISETLSYSNPENVAMMYNGTSIVRLDYNLTHNLLLLNGNVGNFTTNASVTFDINYKISYSNYSSPGITTTEYFALNNSYLDWNITFNQNQVINEGYSIENRQINYYDIPTDWNATELFVNGTSWANDPDNNITITYTNLTSSIIINLSTELSAYDWRILFESPNYISSISLVNSTFQTLAYPYSILSNDTINVSASLLIGNGDGINGSMLFYDYSDILINTSIDKSASSDSLTFTTITLSTVLSSIQNPNGTYTVAVQWVNSAFTKVGFLCLEISVITATSIDTITSISEVIKSDNVNLEINFTNIVNQTTLDGATVYYNTSWTTDNVLSQSASRTNYTGAVDTSTATLGSQHINITAVLANHDSQFTRIFLTIVQNTTLTALSNDTTSLTSSYYDQINISVLYLAVPGDIYADLATVYVNDTLITANNGFSYYYLFNTSTLNPTLSSFFFNINATKLNHKTRLTSITISLIPTTTTANTYGSTPANDGLGETFFSYLDQDNFTFYFEFYDTRHDIIINNSIFTHNGSITDFAITGNGTQELNGTYILHINPLKQGNFTIDFTFTKDGYNTAVHRVNFYIKITNTFLYYDGSGNWINGANHQFIYHNGTNDILTLNLTLFDTQYNQNITNALIVGNVPNINVSLLDQTQNGANYDITINPDQQTNFTIWFTLYLDGYANQTFSVIIEMLQRPTAIQDGSGGTWSGQSTLSDIKYHDGNLDNVTFTLTYNDTYWNELVTDGIILTNFGSIDGLTFTNTTPNTATWFFTVFGEKVGSYVLTFTFQKSTFETIQINITINIIGTGLYVVNDLDVTYTNASYVDVFFDDGTFDETWFFLRLKNNETFTNVDFTALNITPIFPSTSILARGESIAGGIANYTFNPLVNGTYTLKWTFTLTYYNVYVLVLYFNITSTFTSISSPYNNATISIVYDEGINDFINYSYTFQDTYYGQILGTSSRPANFNVIFPQDNNSVSIYYTHDANGSWIISINPNLIGTHTIGFEFSKIYYNSIYVYINITVNYNNVTIYNSTNQQWINQTFNVFYHELQKDNVSVTFSVNSTDYNIINPSNFYNQTSVSGVSSVFLNFGDGNYSLFVDPTQFNTYMLNLTFAKYGYINQTIILTIIVSQTTTQVLNSTNQLWINVTHIRQFNQNTKDNVSLSLTFQDSIYNDYLLNGNLLVINTTNYEIYETNIGNGTWTLIINPLIDGSFSITLTLSQYGYMDQIFYINLEILETTTVADYGIMYWNYNGSSIALTNQTSINQIFSEGEADAFWFLISSNDTSYTEIVNSSFINLSAGSLIFNISMIKLGNNIWNVTVNPINVGSDTFTFRLFHIGYSNITIEISLLVIKPQLIIGFDKITSQDINFANNLTITATITSNFDNSPVTSITPYINSSFIVFSKISDGLFEITYYRGRLYLTGSEYVNMTLFNSNFDVNTTFWTFTIISPTTPLSTLITGNQNYSNEWNNNFTIWMIWSDSNTGFKLNDTSVATINDQDLIITYLGVNNGNHSFNVMIKNPGSFSKIINLDNGSLASYFAGASIQISFTGLKRTTAIIQSIHNSSVVLLYNRESTIWVEWFDPALNEYVVLNSTSITDTNWVNYLNQTNGILYYKIISYRVGSIEVNVTINSNRYESKSYLLTITSNIVPTKELAIAISQGLYANLTNTSKIGYTLDIDVDWRISDTNGQILDSLISIDLNKTHIENSAFGEYGIVIFGKSVGNELWVNKIRITFLPTHGYKKGWYDFNLTFSKYGYINKTLDFSLYIRGFDIKINLVFDPSLVQGTAYTIKAVVVYDNGTIVNTSQLLRFKITSLQGINQNIGDPVDGIDINFLISLTMLDESTMLLNETSPTNPNGEASYTISGDITANIASINSISAGIVGLDISEANIQNVVPNIEVQKVEPLNPLFIAIPVVIVIFLFLIGTLYFRRRSKKIAKVRSILRANLDKLDLVNSTYSIMLTTNTGLPILTKINAVYSKSKAVEELISGLSVGIDTFLSSFQQDFMTKIGTTDQTKVDPNNPHKVFMSAIKRNEFHVLIIGSPNYRGFVFLKDQPTQFVERTFFKIIEQIQAKVIIDVVFDEEETRLEVEKQIKLFYPFTVLDKFVLNAEKLAEADKKNLISKPAAEALMRIFAITTGSINIKETPQKQIAAFNKVLKKNAVFSRASDRMDAIKSGVLYYNTCYNILKSQLKIPPETIVQALWDANIKNIGIFESID
jgi:hypothetical protein